MKVAVITFPASNCDRDAVDAARKISNNVHNIWHVATHLDNDFDLIIIPGGFSFGDYLRSGAMAAISPIMNEVIRLANRGTKIIGICNGFQILTEAGLLPGVLLRNRNIKFINKDITLKVENNSSFFTKNYQKNQIISIPIAHMDGNYFADSETIKMIEDNDMVAWRYSSNEGVINDISNINGSINNIAGIFNKNKNIFGTMPHPERAIDINNGSIDGLPVFTSIIS